MIPLRPGDDDLSAGRLRAGPGELAFTVFVCIIHECQNSTVLEHIIHLDASRIALRVL